MRKPEPSHALNTYTHGSNAERNRQASRCARIHRRWASLLVTALKKKKKREGVMVGVRNEREDKEDKRQDRQHKCIAVIGHTVKSKLQ